MHISPKLAAKLPVRIDISWMKLGNRTEPSPRPAGPADSPEQSMLMNQILELNPSASLEFLAQFSPSALGEYLDHLNSAAMPRGRFARRGRPENTPAVSVRTARI